MESTQGTYGFSLFRLCPFSARTHRSRDANAAEIYVHMREDRWEASSLTKRPFLIHRLPLGLHLKSLPEPGSANYSLMVNSSHWFIIACELRVVFNILNSYESAYIKALILPLGPQNPYLSRFAEPLTSVLYKLPTVSVILFLRF